jgi:Holliday junction resolvase RusA-like endonuclease
LRKKETLCVENTQTHGESFTKLTEHQTIRTKKKNPQTYHNQTISTQNKERILKAAKKKRQVTYKDKPIRITADFSTQTLNSRRSWKDIIQSLKESTRLVYPAKLSFLIEGEIKTFHNKEKLKEFMTTKPALQKILKGLLHIETRVRQEDSRRNKPF